MNTIINRVRTLPHYAQKLRHRLDEMMVARGYPAGTVTNGDILPKTPLRTSPHPITGKVIEIVFLSPTITSSTTEENINTNGVVPVLSYKASSAALEHYSKELFKLHLAAQKRDVERCEKLRQEQGFDSVLIVSPHLHTAIITKRIRNLPIEYWFEGELFVNPFSHHLVPQHRVLSTQEAKEIVKKYGADSIQRLPQDDRIARYLYLQPNDIVEISEINSITLSQVKYRRVVPALIDPHRHLYLQGGILTSGIGATKSGVSSAGDKSSMSSHLAN